MTIVGIDLGTTHSLIGVIKQGRPRLFKAEDGGTLVPSVVWFDELHVAHVGVSAKAKRSSDPDRTLYSVKRFMGRAIDDVREWTRILPFDFSKSDAKTVRLGVGDRSYTPIEISAFILRKLKSMAEKELGERVKKAVITVPAYFNDSQRQATKFAGELAGLEVVRIINEPTAACLAYGLNKKTKGNVAVFDLGGGTFDISILRIKEGVFEVLATHGDTCLGGDDFDHAIAENLKEIALRDRVDSETAGASAIVETARASFIVEAERVKRALSDNPSASFRVVIDGKPFERTVSRGEFDTWIQPILARMEPPCRLCLSDAKLKPEDISDVILVGGATRTPLVKALARALFHRDPICTINPDEVVAMGAAVQANVLSGQTSDVLLLDVTPLSLGIETMGGLVSKIIHRNSTIPVSASEMFTTHVDNQTGVDIHVLQGERELVPDNRSLAKFQLKGLPPMPAGLPKVEVEFIVDANGILSVRATELITSLAASIQVSPSYGLSDEEVERMLRESCAYAETDFEKRFLIEAGTQADSMIRATRRSLNRGGHLIDEQEKQQVEECLRELESLMVSKDYKAIRNRMESLARESQHLAELLLKEALTEAIQNPGGKP